MDDLRGHDKQVAHGDNRGVENYVRSGDFGSVLFGQWLPRTFTASTADEMRRVTLSARVGDICFYAADKANGVDWQFRFRPDGSAYPWKAVGAQSPITSGVATNENTASVTPADLATVGPFVVAPLAGEYQTVIRAQANGPSVALVATVSIAPSVTSSPPAVVSLALGDNQTTIAHGPVIVTAQAAIVMKYQVTAGNCFFANRYLTCVPVRVAG
jgi:hypothetical protein